MRRFFSLLALGLACHSISASAQDEIDQRAAADPLRLCQTGAYRFAAGKVVVLMERKDPRGFAYYFQDGRWGRVGHALSTVRCTGDAVEVLTAAGPQRWPRLALRTTPTRFKSGDVPLAGLLFEPVDGDGKPPLVVSGHGSERSGHIGNNMYPYMLAAQGIAVFQYDKRGTGQSGGRFSSNFRVLANDMAQAAAEARRMAKGRFSRFGLIGGSQAGWVVPLAATLVKPDFLTVFFGGVFSPAEEDLEGMLDQLRQRGYGDETMALVRAFNALTTKVAGTRCKVGLDELRRFKAAHRSAAWFKDLRPDDYSRGFTGRSEADACRNLQETAAADEIDLSYDSMPPLRAITAPTLWILAGEDREAPGRLTEERLAELQRSGRPILISTFPNTDHGIVEFTQDAQGNRTPVRNADGYFRLLGDWIRGCLDGPYGKSLFTVSNPAKVPLPSRSRPCPR